MNEKGKIDTGGLPNECSTLSQSEHLRKNENLWCVQEITVDSHHSVYYEITTWSNSRKYKKATTKGLVQIKCREEIFLEF